MAKKTIRKKAASTRKKTAAAKKNVRTRKAVRKAAKAPAKKAVRKTVRKAPARTAAPTASSARHRVYNLTKDVPEHQYFILANGRQVRHVAELASLLDELEDHVFHHHVTPDRNDFQNWVHHVFEDVDLARKIVGVDEKKRLQLVIYRHLAGHDD